MTPIDIAVSVLAKLLEYTARPFVQPFDYIFHHNTNINGLRNQILCLENTRGGVRRQVDIAEEIVVPIVQDWLAKANGLATESQRFLSDEADRNHRCFSGSCPDLKLIYRSSREARKRRTAADELVERGPSIGVTATTSSGDLDGFESRKAQLRSIMEALEDDNVNIIGVYGMGGIGKTTFVEEVARQADALQLLDEMVMVVVSHKPNLRKLQSDLAEMLELNLKEEGELLRTARLRERLNQVVSLSSTRIVLSNLKSIKLEFLPSLQSFCPQGDASVQEPLFNSKVDFPSLEELTLRELHSVNEIWSGQLSAADFRSLRILIVFGCDNLVLVFPSYMQHMLQNLEILSVEWCDSVQEVCEPNNLQNDASLPTLPSVRDLNLGKLPLLKHLWWNIDPHAYTSLRNLNSLHIYECDGLIHLFSVRAMKNLVQLRQLKVRSCKKMRTIFVNEGEDGVIVLSELCSVNLQDLPQLSSFYQGGGSLEFPLLEMVEIKDCPKIKRTPNAPLF